MQAQLSTWCFPHSVQPQIYTWCTCTHAREWRNKGPPWLVEMEEMPESGISPKTRCRPLICSLSRGKLHVFYFLHNLLKYSIQALCFPSLSFFFFSCLTRPSSITAPVCDAKQVVSLLPIWQRLRHIQNTNMTCAGSW